MKILYCPACKDLFRLHRAPRFCQCKASWGHYKTDGWHALIGGKAIPVGIDNGSFQNAIKNRDATISVSFESFIIPFVCSTIQKVDD